MAAFATTSIGRRTGLVGATLLLLIGCGEDESKQAKVLKSQVQDAFGAKNFAKAYDLSVKGLALARKAEGDKHPDTLYFAQAVSENAYAMRNVPATIRGLKTELDLRSAAKQKEDKLTKRRTLLIQLTEENGDKMTAIAQTVIIAQAIHMGDGKEPQPTYRPESVYPPDAYRQHMEGDVDLAFDLDANGSPNNIRVTHATPPDVFNAAAMENFKRWRFTPYIENDQAVSSTGHHFTLAFRMQASKPPSH